MVDMHSHEFNSIVFVNRVVHFSKDTPIRENPAIMLVQGRALILAPSLLPRFVFETKKKKKKKLNFLISFSFFL